MGCEGGGAAGEYRGGESINCGVHFSPQPPIHSISAAVGSEHCILLMGNAVL